jgi:hypothetical protein
MLLGVVFVVVDQLWLDPELSRSALNSENAAVHVALVFVGSSKSIQ